MKKQEGILRYSLIYNKLRKAPSSYDDIADYLQIESEIQACELVISKRTFQRDLNEIRNLFNIDIQYSRSTKTYSIVTDENEESSSRMLEAFDVFNALNIANRFADNVHFEKRKPQGTEYLQPLLLARKDCKKVQFVYQAYLNDKPKMRKVSPYALKEFKNRWYLLANDTNAGLVKSFALDRISGLSVLEEHFSMPGDFDVNKHYKYCFGIISPNAEEPADVILSFDAVDGKYVKSLPLHESQKIVEDTDEQLIISLRVFLTYDFIMELLSHGDKVEVLQPVEFRNTIKNILEKALKKY